jgi:hypothetical protein
MARSTKDQDRESRKKQRMREGQGVLAKIRKGKEKNERNKKANKRSKEKAIE